MKQRFFVLEPSICIGCFGCVAACVNANQLKGGPHWRKVMKLPPNDGENNTFYLSMSCNHCETPPCVKACPSGAMQIREQDGIVVLDYGKCIGCRYCQMACPYGAIIWMENKKTVGKCIMCFERLDRDELPACVETCFSGALKMVTIDTVDEAIENMNNIENEVIGFEHIKDAKPRIRFVSDSEKEAC